MARNRLTIIRRQKRVRARIHESTLPRLTVFRSNKHIYAQVIDDAKGRTIAAAADTEVKTKDVKVGLARAVGELVAKKAKLAKIDAVVFDRGSYKYHGRVKALAQGAREGGLTF